MKKWGLLCCLLMMVSFVLYPLQDSHATPVSVGQHIKFANGPGTTNGGEFIVSDWDSGEYLLTTFCIEKNEYISYGGEFVVSDISNEARAGGIGGGSPDPISDETAYLYHNFYWGTLEGYDHSDALANDLQNAIWLLENEITEYTVKSIDYVAMATNAVKDGKWSGLGDVRVINLAYPDGSPAQDQLTVAPVPEPATMLLFGTGLIGLSGLGRKRFFKRG